MLARGGGCWKRGFRRLSVNTISWDLARLRVKLLACAHVSTLTTSSDLLSTSVVLNLFHCWCPLNAINVVWDPQVKSDLKLETNSKCGE